MSASRHPIALRLERQVGEGTRLLATVMALPLLDGIFAALVLAGAVSSILGMVEVGLLIFGGSATLAVVLAEMEGGRRDRVTKILLVGVVIVPVAALQAAIAPTIESLVELEIFKRFAALVILAVAAKTASSTIGEYLPSPGIIIGLGLIASFTPNGFEFAFVAEPMYIVYGTGAALVGVGFALSVALFGPWLRGNVDIDRFRFGSAVALGVLPLTILEIGPITGDEPLALVVLGITALLAFNPDGALGETSVEPSVSDAGGAAATDGGEADTPTEEETPAERSETDDDSKPAGESRAPWL